MGLWRRFGSAGFENLIYRCKRCYSVLRGGGAPTAGGVVRLRGFRVLEEPFPGGSPMFCYTHFRYYAALGQVMPKPKAEGKGGDWRKPKVETDVGIRINEAINEREVRLVTDEGHRVVSIQEALYLARKLDLDLVEVQRKVKVEGGARSNIFKPAVCKLMDYCKEKYKQDVKEKGRAKSKAAIALRNGENKEVRFKAKTELKDLKIKAESVKRLMERGYRVKCTAMPAGKEDEDRGALLLNLLSLIEDISVVESGPHLDAKNAYVIVKHVKFASKKGKKVGKALDTVSSVLSSRSNAAADSSLSKDEDDPQAEEEWEAVESDSETEIDGSAKQTDDAKAAIAFNAKHRISNRIMSSSDESIDRSSGMNASGSHLAETNRYSRPTKAADGNQQRFPVRNRGREIDGRGQSNPNDRPPAHNHRPNSSSRGPNAPDLPQQRYGAFSSAKPYPPIDERRTREISSDGASRSNSSTSSYGIFSAPRISSSSDDQMKGRDASRDDDAGKSGNASPRPSPRFGIFTSSKKASSGDGRVGDKN